MKVKIEVSKRIVGEIEGYIEKNKSLIDKLNISLTLERVIESFISMRSLRDSKILDTIDEIDHKIKRFQSFKESLLEDMETIKKLIELHPELKSFFNYIVKKREEYFSLIREVFNKTNSCKSCNDCCCRNSNGYFTSGDILYLVLTNQDLGVSDKQILDNIINHGTKRNCVFLSPIGCILKYDVRPSTCVTAICDKLNSELKKLHKYSEAYKLRDESYILKDIFRKLTDLNNLKLKLSR